MDQESTKSPRFVEKIRLKAATIGTRLRSAKSLCEKLKSDTKAFLLCIQKGNKNIFTLKKRGDSIPRFKKPTTSNDP